MSRAQTWRIAVTLLLVIAAIYYAWPTARFWMLSGADKDRLQNENPAKLFTMKQEAVRLGLDLQGGMHVVLRIQKEKLDATASKDAVDRALEIIRSRIDQFGVTEPVIQKSGDDRIIVDLPGFTDVERAEKLIGETAQLQFKLLESQENATLLLSKIDEALVELRRKEGGEPAATPRADTADTGKVNVLADLLGDSADTSKDAAAMTDEELDQPFSTYLEPIPGTDFPEFFVETEMVPNVKALLEKPEVQKVIPSEAQFALGRRSEIYTGRQVTRFYVMKSRVQMSGEYLTDAIPQTDQYGKPTVNFQLTREGGRIFSRVSGPNIGKPLAIVLDGRVESAPVIQDRIRDRGQITMGSGATYAEARDLSIVLKAGALPTDVEIIKRRSSAPRWAVTPSARA